VRVQPTELQYPVPLFASIPRPVHDCHPSILAATPLECTRRGATVRAPNFKVDDDKERTRIAGSLLSPAEAFRD
jgi:hypothetical protein